MEKWFVSYDSKVWCHFAYAVRELGGLKNGAQGDVKPGIHALPTTQLH